MGNLVHTLFALAGLLAVVSFLPPLAQRLRLPYTVLLAVVGVAIGTAIHLGRQTYGLGAPVLDVELSGLGPVGDFLAALGDLKLTSAAFLHIFLPVLLFDMALSVNVRRLMDDLWPILLLAVVAVLLSTAISGLGMWGAWYLWNGVWSTQELVVCLMLAAIVATTDPAAVVGIFRDLGAPRRLSILVEGESLFNDAAAIALFTLLLGMVTAGAAGANGADIGAAAVAFLVKFLGGLAVGYVLGWVAMMVVTPLHDQPQAEITVTVSLAYLAFIVAETYAGVSGVVAVVTAGLVVSAEGRTRISPESWGGLQQVWSQLGFWANSLIFILASMLVPPTLMGATWGHVLILAALIVSALVARALVIYGMLPALTAVGAADRISNPYKAVMLWGGLRGAVSLALGLAVSENQAVSDDTRSLVAVVVTGFVLFTLFVQGTTLRPLIRLLGIDKLSPLELILRNRALGLSLGDVRKEVERTANDFHMDPAPAVQPLLERGAELAQEQLDLEARHGGLSADDRIYIGLSTLARREEELYLDLFRDGVISRRIVQILTTQAGRLQDAVKTGGQSGYVKASGKFLRLSRRLRSALLLHRRFGIQRALAARLTERFAMLLTLRLVLQALLRFNGERLAPMLGRDAAATLSGLLERRQIAVEEALEALRLQYPTYAEAVQERYLARAGLRFEERSLNLLFEEALISREILQDLSRELRERRREVERPPALDLGLSTSELVDRVSLFSGLPEDRLKRIEKLFRPRLTVPDEIIVRRGERGDSMYVVASGAVLVKVPGLAHPVRLGSGDVFGEMALLYDEPRNADVISSAYCRLLVLQRRDLARLFEEDPALRAHFYDVAVRRLPRAG
ncbi:cation:proton antiporter [Indioceanicola profundi]|uniref:cation:proton antiporter n=1 Tax=Indioceanicola profundi TaxID=2220096 RepID=UPI000E6AA6CB|nr:cation:proton antiporter [Indioceanicola profundi]